MKEMVLQFHSWQTCEIFNGALIEYNFENNRKKTPAMSVSYDAKSYCCGPSMVVLNPIENNKPFFEGHCIFSFCRQNAQSIHNTQVFELYQNGYTNSTDDVIVIRCSTWNRDEDIKTIAQKKELEKWSCMAQSIVFHSDIAISIILAIKKIGDLFDSGISQTKRHVLATEDYLLNTINSNGVSYSIRWNDSIQLSHLEEKIREMQCLIGEIDQNYENIDYKLSFFF